MNKEVNIAVIQWLIITILSLIYVAFAVLFVGPYVTNIAFGQVYQDPSNPYNPNMQYQDPSQYGQQYGQYNQYQQPYQDPYSYQQYGSTPYMQPQYGYQQPYPQAQNPIQFGTSEVIYTLLGGGAIGYARYNQHKRNQDKESMREQMAFQLKTMEAQKELARVTYQMNTEQSNKINDAPAVKLETLEQNVDEFREKVAKT